MEELSNYEYKIKEYILPDESLLWTARPVKEIKLLPAEKFNMIFGIFWTAFSAFWIALATMGALSASEAGFSMIKIFPFFGLPFLAIGIYLIFIAPIKGRNRRKNMEYALTSKRILILYSGKTKVLQAFKYGEIQNVHFASDEQDVGCVTFMNTVSTITDGSRVSKGVYGLYNIPNIKKVYKIFAQKIGE